MKDLVRLTDFSAREIENIFKIADEVQQGRYQNALNGKTAVMFFPSTSIRTRVTFEKGVNLLGGQTVLFPTETLDKKEDLRDVFGYLDNWADLIIVRHRDISVLEKIADYSTAPVINAMTATNHPCEVLSDLYAFKQKRKNILNDKFLFCGTNGNIGLAWKEASEVLGFELEQCCAEGFEIDGIKSHHNIYEAVRGKDIICTDSLPYDLLGKFKKFQISKAVMELANKGAVLNPCPPFYRGEEVTDDVISSDYFVGYDFKKYLLPVQQAIMLYCLS